MPTRCSESSAGLADWYAMILSSRGNTQERCSFKEGVKG